MLLLSKIKNGLQSDLVNEYPKAVKALDSYSTFLLSFPPVTIRECLDVVDFHEINKEQRKKMAVQWERNIQQMEMNKRALESIQLDKA